VSAESLTLADPTELLESMYRGEPQLGADGKRYPLDVTTGVSRDEGTALRELHSRLKPTLSIEIGLAYGFSTTHILWAMQEGSYGHHVAIDRDQYQACHGIGATRAKLIGMEESFSLIEQHSAAALGQLAAKETQAGFILIDGDHRFDGVLVDYYLADMICPLGGVIVFDDTWMPSIRRVIRFIEANRGDYKRLSNNIPNAIGFEKVDIDRRQWDHYVGFGEPLSLREWLSTLRTLIRTSPYAVRTAVRFAVIGLGDAPAFGPRRRSGET
jgi:predicted O-methyltransferase YrrM